MNEISIAFQGTPKEIDADSRDLAQWLEETENLDVEVRPRVTPPRPGEAGGWVEMLQLVLAAAPVVVPFLQTWLERRAQRGRVTFTLTASTGETEEIVVERPADVPETMRRVRLLLTQ
ncbi:MULTISPECIES: effector-associated constant component EACC1 [Streptomyces]|uniref:Uncharacterized protein n=1 Tax=Streptomyces alboflavus TaxID=67267 RepID=A0A1Z1W5F9_9ACTN|nr:hypothetical protein [Streptomyces alboflavus]ARX81650.1 hypothetical protein SMD44_01048 [Streptomyces alboflavus]